MKKENQHSSDYENTQSQSQALRLDLALLEG